MKTYWPSIALVSYFFISDWPFFAFFDLPLIIAIGESSKTNRLNLPFSLAILLTASLSKEPLLMAVLLLPFVIQHFMNTITTERNLFTSIFSVIMKVVLTYGLIILIKMMFFDLLINYQYLSALLLKSLLTMLLALVYSIKVTPWISGQSSFSP